MGAVGIIQKVQLNPTIHHADRVEVVCAVVRPGHFNTERTAPDKKLCCRARYRSFDIKCVQVKFNSRAAISHPITTGTANRGHVEQEPPLLIRLEMVRQKADQVLGADQGRAEIACYALQNDTLLELPLNFNCSTVLITIKDKSRNTVE